MRIRRVLICTLLEALTIIASCTRGAEVKVSMKNFLYIPAEVTIKRGDGVIWTNDDIEPHTVTTADWDSGAINPGESYSRTFDTAGTFEIYCVFHAGMVEKVIVTQPGD